MAVKGKTNNPNGRPKGTPNKITKNLREKISEWLENNFSTIQSDLMLMEPAQRVKAYSDLLKYALPALQNVSASFDFENMTDTQIEKIVEMLTAKSQSNS